jgi:hypothetical protein
MPAEPWQGLGTRLCHDAIAGWPTDTELERFRVFTDPAPQHLFTVHGDCVGNSHCIAARLLSTYLSRPV